MAETFRLSWVDVGHWMVAISHRHHFSNTAIEYSTDVVTDNGERGCLRLS